MADWKKLGVIAGAGDLPVRLAEHCAATQQPYFVARIEGLADAALAGHPGASFGLGEMGARFKALKSVGFTGYMAYECAISGSTPEEKAANLAKSLRFVRDGISQAN